MTRTDLSRHLFERVDSRVTLLPDSDPNEFGLEHGKEHLSQLLAGAQSPVLLEIDQVDPAWSPEMKIEALDNVFRRCKKMKPLQRAATVTRLSETLGFSRRQADDHIDSMPNEDDSESDVLDLSNCSQIHPAFDMVDDTLIMTVPQAVINDETDWWSGSLTW